MSSLSDKAPFAYRRATPNDTINTIGFVGPAWYRYWVVVDRTGQPFLFKKSAKKAKMDADDLNFRAAKEIMAGGKPD